MKVQLAYPYDGHEADEVVEVPDGVGQRLINEGRARVPAESKTSKTSKASSKSTSETTSKENDHA